MRKASLDDLLHASEDELRVIIYEQRTRIAELEKQGVLPRKTPKKYRMYKPLGLDKFIETLLADPGTGIKEKIKEAYRAGYKDCHLVQLQHETQTKNKEQLA